MEPVTRQPRSGCAPCSAFKRVFPKANLQTCITNGEPRKARGEFYLGFCEALHVPPQSMSDSVNMVWQGREDVLLSLPCEAFTFFWLALWESRIMTATMMTDDEERTKDPSRSPPDTVPVLCLHSHSSEGSRLQMARVPEQPHVWKVRTRMKLSNPAH